MPRDASGNYTLPNAAFATAAVISSVITNSNYSDISTALTQSVDTTGVSTMVGPFIAAAGVVTAPSIAFNNLQTCGWYLSAANEISYATSAVRTHKWSSSGLTMVSANLVDKNGNNVFAIPIGLIVPYAGASAPSLWAFCYGQAVSQTTYATLYALVSTAYGNPGGGNFGLPDLRGSAPFGLDNMGGSTAGRITNALSGIVGTTLGASGGAQNLTITVAVLPNITWTKIVVTHTHSFNTPSSNTTNSSAASCLIGDVTSRATSANTTGVTLASNGSGTSMASMSPLLILNYIIYLGV